MKALCTFPGRAGDLLWALPTVRAISEFYEQPVDLVTCGEFDPLVPLLRCQPYLSTVAAHHGWPLVPPREWDPPPAVRVEGYDRVYHLGYRGWPSQPLPLEVYDSARVEYGLPLPKLDLTRPWIQVDGPGVPCDIACGWTDCWFELKLGLMAALDRFLDPHLLQLCPHGSRWTKEVRHGVAAIWACDWLEAARAIRNSDLFLGDCSALHVLAVGLGKPVVLVEPMEARHNPIFYPLGTHERVRLVRGNDGLPSFDSRHAAETIQEVLRAT